MLSEAQKHNRKLILLIGVWLLALIYSACTPLPANTPDTSTTTATTITTTTISTQVTSAVLNTVGPSLTMDIRTSPSPEVTPHLVSTSTPTPSQTPSILPQISLRQSFAGFSMAYSPDGQFIALGRAEEEELMLVKSDTGETVWTLQAPDEDLPRPSPHWGLTIGFSPDGSRMAFGGAEEKIYLVDTATGQILDKRVHNDVITNLAFSPNGELIISASCNENPGITIWHLKEETTDRYDVSACLSTVSPTQPLVAISGSGLTAIFDPSNGQFNHMFAEDSGSFSMAFSPDGKVLAAEINGELRFWDLVVANEIMLVPWQDYQSEILFVAWSSNNLLALLSADGTIVVWNVVDQKVIGVGTVQFDFVDNSRMIFSPDGSQLALVDKNGIGIWAIPLPPRE